MTTAARLGPCVAIACGGTGGHLFPGRAVGEELLSRGCCVQLLVSPKDVDREAVKDLKGMEVVTLPAVGLVRGGVLAFAAGFWRAYRVAKGAFKGQPPRAVLAMGGFTSAAPILAAKRLGARTFLHESNTIPGRANRWLSRFVDQAFVGFPTAAGRLRARSVLVTGTPVRAHFLRRDPRACRRDLGLDPERPVIMVLGGSQGASGINQLIVRSLPLLLKTAPQWQWFHLTGQADLEIVKKAYGDLRASAVVRPFSSEMELVLAACSAAVSRAGASSLAELAAMQVPAVLIPYPSAADNHQFHNARAFAESGAAHVLAQAGATAEGLIELLREIVEDPAAREKMQQSLAQWHAPRAAEAIAGAILRTIGCGVQTRGGAGLSVGGELEKTPGGSASSPTKTDAQGRLGFA